MANYFIIGGSSGIGRHLSVRLAKSGHHVYATYNEHKPESDIPGLIYKKCNVLEDEIDIDFLPETIEGLIYCPGSINLKPFHRIKPVDFIKDFELQLVGVVKMIQAAFPKLKASGNASVVLFSTVAVQTGFPFHTQVAASKGAIEGLSKSLAAELAPKIRVNCVAPSLTDTRMAAHLLASEDKRKANAERHPLKKIGKPEDIANMIEFLLSEKSGWITGQVFHVDGGMSTIKI
jgi:NAD(P)-dependent dehydrogenase (short-subunit alcohol dehydrogenase family)